MPIKLIKERDVKAALYTVQCLESEHNRLSGARSLQTAALDAGRAWRSFKVGLL